MSKDGRRTGFRTESGSGLPDTITMTVTESYFARDPNYNQGQTLCLIMKGEVEEALANGEAIEVDLEENPILFPCGQGWDSFDNGETAEHERGRKGFTDRSGVGMLVDRACETLGIEDELAARGDSMLESKIWKGLKFVFEREEINYGINKQTGQEMKASRMLPTKFLGGDGAKAAPKAEAANETTGSVDLSAIDAKVLAKLKVAAKQADNEGAFADAAIEVDGVAEDDNLMAAVADGSLYASLS